MDRTTLRACQAPLKDKFRDHPAAATVTAGAALGATALQAEADTLPSVLARQAEIHALAEAGRPVDTGAMQDQLGKLIALVEGATRPGSRPNLLMARARRAVALRPAQSRDAFRQRPHARNG